jgi:hypothetical protein
MAALPLVVTLATNIVLARALAGPPPPRTESKLSGLCGMRTREFPPTLRRTNRVYYLQPLSRTGCLDFRQPAMLRSDSTTVLGRVDYPAKSTQNRC